MNQPNGFCKNEMIMVQKSRSRRFYGGLNRPLRQTDLMSTLYELVYNFKRCDTRNHIKI